MRAVLRVDQVDQFLRALGKRGAMCSCSLSEVVCRMVLSCAPKARIHALQVTALMTTSLTFREYVLSRNDLENIILPLLRSLHEHHRSAPMPPSHLYVVLILLLMFSQVCTSNATFFGFVWLCLHVD